jgi:hypothetical protein
LLTVGPSADPGRVDTLLSESFDDLTDDSLEDPPFPSIQDLNFDIHSSFSAIFSAFRIIE